MRSGPPANATTTRPDRRALSLAAWLCLIAGVALAAAALAIAATWWWSR